MIFIPNKIKNAFLYYTFKNIQKCFISRVLDVHNNSKESYKLLDANWCEQLIKYTLLEVGISFCRGRNRLREIA